RPLVRPVRSLRGAVRAVFPRRFAPQSRRRRAAPAHSLRVAPSTRFAALSAPPSLVAPLLVTQHPCALSPAALVPPDHPATLSLTLARLKAEAVAVRLGPADGVLVLGCDSVLEFDGAVLGKPADAAEATRRWYGMRGRRGVLHTGHCLISLGDGKRAEAVA